MPPLSFIHLSHVEWGETNGGFRIQHSGQGPIDTVASGTIVYELDIRNGLVYSVGSIHELLYSRSVEQVDLLWNKRLYPE